MFLTLTNSRGRVLFVVECQYDDDDFYAYRGDGCVGNGTKLSVMQAAWVMKQDAPSARATGSWSDDFRALPPLW